MEKQVRELKGLIDRQLSVKSGYDSAKRDFEEFTSGSVLLLKELSADITAKKAEIEVLAKADFAKNKIKKLFGGVGIQEKSLCKYDMKDALKFAKEKDMFLLLDKKSFETAAGGLDLDFVTSEKVVKVTFPKVIEVDK